MTPEKTKFVNDLFGVFCSNPVAGAVDTRLRWHLLDDEILGTVRAWAISEAGFDAAAQQADLAAGMLGLSTSPRTGMGPRAESLKGFSQILFSIAQSRGDPPFPAAFRQHSLQAVTGQLGTTQAMSLLASDNPQLGALISAYSEFLLIDPVVAAVLAETIRVCGALALPRNQLYDFYVALHGNNAESARAAFEMAVAEVTARTGQEPARAHEVATEALALAARTSEVSVQIRALSELLKFPPEMLSETEVIESANQLSHLPPSGADAKEIAACIYSVRRAATRKGIEAKVLTTLATTAQHQLRGSPAHEGWVALADVAVRTFARAGRPDTAAAILGNFRQRAADDKERQLVTTLEAECRWFSGDKDGAHPLWIENFTQTPKDAQWMAALSVIQTWPPNRPGRERYVDIFLDGLYGFPLRWVILPVFLSLMLDDWGEEPVGAILKRLDIRRIEAGLADKERQSFERQMQPMQALQEQVAPVGPGSTPLDSPNPPVTDDAAILTLLRQRLLSDLSTETVVGARGVELAQTLKELEGLLEMPQDTVAQQQARLDRLRTLMMRHTALMRTPSFGRPLPPDGSLRARMRTQLRSLLQLIVQELLRPLRQPGERQHEADLALRIFQFEAGVMEASGDADALGFWPSIRTLAVEVAEYERRNHLTLAHPIFKGPEALIDASAVYFAGSDAMRESVREACAERGLSLLTGSGRGPVAEDRWSALRSAAVAVFDLTVSPGPDLAAVCYELGVALALGKPVVPLRKPERPVPFDVDVTPTSVGPAQGETAQQILEAVELALFCPDRGEPCGQMATFATLKRELGDLGRSGNLKVLLDSARSCVNDPVRFRTAVADVLGAWGSVAPQLLLPSWPPRYPDESCCFHVMPFSAPWSDAVAQIAEASCAGRAKYLRGDRGKEFNILRRIWANMSASTHVLVDLTGFNANVAIELGMAHTLGRYTCIVAQGDVVSSLFPMISKIDVFTYEREDGYARLRRLVEQFLS